MGLTVFKKQRLAKKRFPELYEDHKDAWGEMLTNAVEYLDKGLPVGERILMDDVQKALVDMIAINPVFAKYLEEESLPQLYWAKDFSDYIIDQKYGTEFVKRGQPE